MKASQSLAQGQSRDEKWKQPDSDRNEILWLHFLSNNLRWVTASLLNLCYAVIRRQALREKPLLRELLDLKQQQTSVLEAFAALRQAEEFPRQGNTILVSTLVTIFFAPLTFIASIFSMQAHEITAGWPISRIMEIIC
ncbi:hypothetical protein BDV12DRAFT_194736 [Aspergillus spectabilis]